MNANIENTSSSSSTVNNDVQYNDDIVDLTDKLDIKTLSLGTNVQFLIIKIDYGFLIIDVVRMEKANLKYDPIFFSKWNNLVTSKPYKKYKKYTVYNLINPDSPPFRNNTVGNEYFALYRNLENYQMS